MKHEYPHPEWRPKYDLDKSNEFITVLWLVMLWLVKIIVIIALMILYFIIGESAMMARKTDRIFKWCLI